MAGLQLSGLVSGLDWRSVVDQLIDLQRAPITRLESEKATNSSRSTALSTLGTKLEALRAAAAALQDTTLFSGRTAASTTTSSSWSAKATPGTATGSYRVAVSQLASSARYEGAGDIGSALSTTSDVSGLTLATLPTATAVTAGTITVNGQQVTIDLADSLQDVFDAISTATSGEVTGAYDPATDKVTLTSSTGDIVLGAANDSSNLLRALRLGIDAGGASATSTTSLGATAITSTIANSRLSTAITAVDGNGAGTFTINGVQIAYDVDSESISTILTKINQSSAGVTASYDQLQDRVILVNNATGDLGVSVSEAAGGLLGALGLTSSAGASLVRGQNAQFSVNGGSTLTSASNTLDSTSHGIAGFSLTVDSEETQTVKVAADTASMRTAIDKFVSAYNDVQDYIDEKSKITSADGKVTTGVLASNREVQNWTREMRTKAFGAISGLGGSIARLENLGIDFNSSGKLEIDGTKLDDTLASDSEDVAEFFQTSGTGFAHAFEDLMDRLIDQGDNQEKRLTKSNSDIDRQIADLERRLVQERERMEAAFIRMEEAQSTINTQSAALSNMLSSSSS